MANKSCAVKVTLTYEGPDSTTLVETASVSAVYQALSMGTLDVPDLESGATVHAVPFGGIGTNANCALIKNRTGQELDVKINGAAVASHSIPTGGVMLIAAATEAASVPLTQLDLITTGAQANAGYIDYFLFGDSV